MPPNKKMLIIGGAVAFVVVLVIILVVVFSSGGSKTKSPYPTVQLVEGDTVNCPSGAEIYVLEGGKKRWIQSWNTYVNNYVSKGKSVIRMDCTALAAIPEGTPIP